MRRPVWTPWLGGWVPEPEIRVGRNPEHVAEIAAGELVSRLRSVLDRRERACLALSGGSTPGPLYRRLAGWPQPPDWERIDVYQVDERCVPPDHAASNHRLLRETLEREAGGGSPAIHRIQGELPAREAASLYAERLARSVRGNPPALDAVVLGVGADGHTASLFPGTTGLEENAWVVPTRSPVPPRQRVSLSMAVLQAAGLRVVVVTGASKREVIGRLLGPSPVADLPAARLAGSTGRTLWVLDEAAAGAVVA